MVNNQHNNIKTFISTKFAGKKDKGGNDYIDHVLYVSQNAYKLGLKLGYNNDQLNNVIVVGLLHDTIEDCVVSIEQLARLTSIENIIRVCMLTRTRGMTYSKYFDNIIQSDDSVTILVKAVDCFHNSQIDRLNKQNVDEQDISRCKKYLKRANKLISILNSKYRKDVTFDCLK